MLELHTHVTKRQHHRIVPVIANPCCDKHEGSEGASEQAKGGHIQAQVTVWVGDRKRREEKGNKSREEIPVNVREGVETRGVVLYIVHCHPSCD